jgi:V-type H+-transporting ATPase subunit a
MFGDVFHGVILTVFAISLCMNTFPPGSMMRELAKIRYLLLLMGFFSIYCGFIYNDYTSIPMAVMGPTCYNV